MKFIYFNRDPSSFNSGVNKKILSQVKFLKKINVDAKLCWLIDDIQKLPLNENIVPIVFKNVYNSSGIFNIIKREHLINLKLYDIICSLREDDIVYMRSPYPFGSLLYTLSKPRKCKVIVEYQTIEPREYKIKGKHLYLFIDFLFGNKIRKNIDGIVGVTDEITKYQLKRSNEFNKPHLVLGNGFDVSSVPVRHPTPISNGRIDLLCVANVNPWHGLDRLLKGMASYKGNIEIYFHIIGDGAEVSALKQVVNNLMLQKYVIFYGFVDGANLDSVFNQCHIAVGSLGIHRIGLTQASVLKVREYCSRGIPFLYGVSDPDFSEDFPYMLRIPDDESSVDIYEVIKFSNRVLNDSNHHLKMREYAMKSLDWSFKMNKLKEFLELSVNDI